MAPTVGIVLRARIDSDIVPVPRMMTSVLVEPTLQGLADVVKIAKTGVTSATLKGAVISDGRYTLIFRSPPADSPAPGRVLDEMEHALNTHRLDTTDPTGILLRFE